VSAGTEKGSRPARRRCSAVGDRARYGQTLVMNVGRRIYPGRAIGLFLEAFPAKGCDLPGGDPCRRSRLAKKDGLRQGHRCRRSSFTSLELHRDQAATANRSMFLRSQRSREKEYKGELPSVWTLGKSRHRKVFTGIDALNLYMREIRGFGRIASPLTRAPGKRAEIGRGLYHHRQYRRPEKRSRRRLMRK